MKNNIKRVLLSLLMVACLFSLAACTKAADVNTMDPQEGEALKQQTVQFLENVAQIPADQLGQIIDQNKKAGSEAIAAGLESYQKLSDEIGAYIDSDEGSIKEADEGYIVTVNANFEKRAVVFSVGLSEDKTSITSMSFSPVYSLAENMEKAAMNMLMGMGTVFMVLIFISILIGCFKYIKVFEDRMKKSNTPAPAPVQAPVVETPVEENLADDLELVAVITAAIAASEGTSADGLVVRSIKRANVSKWKRA